MAWLFSVYSFSFISVGDCILNVTLSTILFLCENSEYTCEHIDSFFDAILVKKSPTINKATVILRIIKFI